jgi:hypothetical protein
MKQNAQNAIKQQLCRLSQPQVSQFTAEHALLNTQPANQQQRQLETTRLNLNRHGQGEDKSQNLFLKCIYST